MDLLDIARGPVLAFALSVFVLGSAWRLIGLWRRPSMRDLSAPRAGAPSKLSGALRAVVRGMWPHQEFGQTTLVMSINAYVFHIGLALVFFGYAPHIAFIHRISGLRWSALPDPVMYLAAGVTIISLLMALFYRLTSPVLRKISNLEDMISWTAVFLPLVTGMAVVGETSTAILARDHVIYGVPLALHLLTLELLLIWFPFGKLMHAFLFVLARGATGIRFSHRGVDL